MKDKKNFSILPRIKNSTHAWRGVGVLFKSSPNTWALSFFGLLAIYLGFLLHISNIEWVLIILTISLVLVAEAINTAIEIDINLTSPEYHPYARDTKDVAAGAVLLATFAAAIIGLIIFLPKIF
ncbi:MAG: diacylglycerol kinase family protein [Patescibacteria group bacterium]|nr:diacylglycerol kinase family protein [Patescibacteria group bacterium]